MVLGRAQCVLLHVKRQSIISYSSSIKFINTVAKNSNIAIGHGLESCTSAINTVRLSFPEQIASDIVFVDTPGFDHTNKTETDILKMVADWLKTTYVILEMN